MQIEKHPPLFCKICNEAVSYKKIYNSLFNGYVNITMCKNNHFLQYPIKYKEVCPICNLVPIDKDQIIKKCINNHSWMICKKCKYISVSKNTVCCEKCTVPKSFFGFFCFHSS